VALNTSEEHAGAPDPNARRVGEEIRRLRNELGLTLRALAEQCGLSAGFLSLAERGQSSLSLTSLFTLAKALGVDATELLGKPGAGALERYTVRRSAESSDTRIVTGDKEHTVLTGNLPKPQLEVLRTSVDPTDFPPASTQHEGEEFCFVLEGQLRFILDGEEIDLAAGDSIHFTSTVPHTVHNRSDNPAHLLWVVDHPLLKHP
jgi:transcriptional regulator with XRE-family HTH domain